MASHFPLKRRYFTLPASLHPLAEKQFGIFWSGAFLSSIGFWIQTVGQGWQVLQLTNSALLLGFVTFAATLPNIVLSLLGGAIADRFNRRWLLLGTQTAYMCTAALLGILTTLHIVTVWQIIVLALVNGTFSSVGFPTWQAFIGDLVPADELKQGIALNSMQFNLSRVVGPAIGGLSIGVFGIAGSYYLNAFSYVAVIVPLLFIHPALKERKNAPRNMWRGLADGIRYVNRRPLLQIILLLQFTIAFLVAPYTTLLPIFARDIFHIGATGLGIMNALSGIGAMIGTLLFVLVSARLQRGGRLLLILCVVGGLSSLLFAFARDVRVALLLLAFMGACSVVSMTVTNTTLQAMAPQEIRGRVISIYVMVTFGLAPLGNLVAGWIAQAIGAPATLAIGGTLCACIALAVVCSRFESRSYQRSLVKNYR
ncbi:MAG TPA: MFS transporter [Ktedonobacteraceae bacterium]|nr:MFS transporter [Ktedonobacteraceae bacterium]